LRGGLEDLFPAFDHVEDFCPAPDISETVPCRNSIRGTAFRIETISSAIDRAEDGIDT
jgi:hypothetical protein